MYKEKETVYADAGKMLASATFKGWSNKGNLEDFTEVSVTLEDITVGDQFITCSNGDCVILKRPNYTYADWKKHFIGLRYSNDDQIAIILNKDDSPEDVLRFNRMQDWRQWSAQLASKILEIQQQ